jgi:Insertion element 4 transposase N-terminal
MRASRTSGSVRGASRMGAPTAISLRACCGCLDAVRGAEAGIAMTEGILERVVQPNTVHLNALPPHVSCEHEEGAQWVGCPGHCHPGFVSASISLGVIARAVPLEAVRQVLAQSGGSSQRERDLPAHVMVCYVIALALYMESGMREVLRVLLDGLRWMRRAGTVKLASKNALSQAHRRLGEDPLRHSVSTVGAPARQPRHKGRLVSRLAAGQPGRQPPRCRRYSSQHHGFRPSGIEPREQRVSPRLPYCMHTSPPPCPLRRGPFFASMAATANRRRTRDGNQPGPVWRQPP